MKCYLSGPMSGIPLFNFPTFMKADAELTAAGWEIVNPAQMDLDAGINPESEDEFTIEQYRDALARDLRAIMDCEGLILLEGWGESTGAQAELALARSLGMKVFKYEAEGPGIISEFSDPTAQNSGQSRAIGSLLFDEETQFVTSEGGARKGQKIARYDLIPWEALAELASAYGKGSIKYGDGNWLKGGYRYTLAIGAMLRHLYRWIAREDFDPETGIHHLALVSWHAFALMTFQARNLGEDDRPNAPHS